VDALRDVLLAAETPAANAVLAVKTLTNLALAGEVSSERRRRAGARESARGRDAREPCRVRRRPCADETRPAIVAAMAEGGGALSAAIETRRRGDASLATECAFLASALART